MNAKASKRRYQSVRRATQALETRADIARAARQLFVTRGWAATTMREVAEEAGVSVPTVYAAYGHKAGLVQALVDAAGLSADASRMLADLEEATADPERQLAAMAAFDRRLFERAGDVIVLMREAGRTEPELASAYRDGRRQADETRVEVFSSWPPGVLRHGVDIQTAVDIYAAFCNIDVYTTLTTERGWEPDRIQRWWSGALARELLDPGHRVGATRPV